MARGVSRVVLAAALACLFAAVASAQTTTETKKFEIVAVDGNQVVVKLPEGTRELTVPEDFRFDVNGQKLAARDLKPGMTGTATITTKTTMKPVTVTEVKNGTVFDVTGSSIIVRTDEGFKSFTQGQVEKRGVRIMRDGKIAEVSDFHKGDQLTAVIITTKPPQMVTEKAVSLSSGGAAAGGTKAAGGGAAAGRTAAGGAAAGGAAAGGAAAGGEGAGGAAAPKKLPKTGSPLPLGALVGAFSLLTAIGLTIRRRR
jgi:LPXTG-motif cell wall-anchored protein